MFKVDIHLISCCTPIGGYIWVKAKKLAESACKETEIRNCTIGWKLQFYLKTRGINI